MTLLADLTPDLEGILSSYGENEEDNGPILRCNIGDSVYLDLVRALESRLLLSDEERELCNQYQFERIKTDPEIEDKDKVLEKAERAFQFFKTLGNIEYAPHVQRQAPLRNSQNSFIGLPFCFFDSHIHSYEFIRNYILRTKERVTIVRFDFHSDDYEIEDRNLLSKGNYIRFLLDDSELSKYIQEVITTHPFKSRPDKIRNDVPVKSMPISQLPLISSPVLLDIDLDGHEEAETRGEEYRGGCWFKGVTIESTIFGNQKYIKIHPKLVTKLLRDNLPNTREVYVATERRYRNAVFHSRVEYDFLESLAI